MALQESLERQNLGHCISVTPHLAFRAGNFGGIRFTNSLWRMSLIDIQQAVEEYGEGVQHLSSSDSTTEGSYYGELESLFETVLNELDLPSDVRTHTSEERSDRWRDQPDIAIYDRGGDFPLILGEVKLPNQDLVQMAMSTDQENQVGRYLAQTNAVLLSNIRGFGLVVPSSDYSGDGPVPTEHREFIEQVDLWPNSAAFQRGEPADTTRAEGLRDLVEFAVSSFSPIGDPETLARVLALQARRAKEELPTYFTSAVSSLVDDFGDALGITFEDDEGEEFFRSSLIQTVYYGLFAGWILWAREDHDEEFDWRRLPDYITIPFLGELFYEIQHPRRIDELNIAPSLDLASETLERVDQDRFFDRITIPSLGSEEDDPERAASTAIVYFYEPFLATFDPELRKELGVWYTPPEIVRYQVRKVDELLRTELGCERGFADERVVVLDPACGTGAYLIEVLSCIAETLRDEGIEAELGETLLQASRDRVLGFEVLTAPFVVAHLQLHLILDSLGARPDEEHRPGVFLTNALTGWEEEEQIELHFPELQEERDAAHSVKTEKQIIVVLGNPPYNRFTSAAVDEEKELVDAYKGVHRDNDGNQVGATELYRKWGIQKHLLKDLYIRFFRIAEKRIGEEADHGVVSYISNNSYLAGRSHPVMRESLLTTFDEMWVDNLHGNRNASERTPWGGSCETIFSSDNAGGIKVGTAVSTLVKRDESDVAPEDTDIHIRDFWGDAEKKRKALLRSLSLEEWSEDRRERATNRPEGPRPYEQFQAKERQKWKLVLYSATGGYEDWYSIDELFPESVQGVNPNRGISGSVICMDRDVLADRMQDYFSDLSFSELSERYPELCKDRARYDPKSTRDELRRKAAFEDDRVVPYSIFPLDGRYLYYETREKLLNEHRPGLWRSLDDNDFLVAVPQPRRRSESIPLFTKTAFDLHLHDRGSVGFPAKFVPEDRPEDLFNSSSQTAKANLEPAFWNRIKSEWGKEGDLTSDDAIQFTQDLFRVCLALGHSPQYQEDHRDTLQQDWARVPIPKDQDVFESLVEVGDQIATLLEPFTSPRNVIRDLLGQGLTSELARLSRRGGGTVREEDLVVDISYFAHAKGKWVDRPWNADETAVEELGERTGDLYLNDEIYLSNVPEQVWRFELGGYPVIKKWLGYRQARFRDGAPLTLSEKDMLRQVVHRLSALLVLHPRLDELYDQSISDPWRLEEAEEE